MNADDIETALRALTEAFRYQPLHDKAAWTRYLAGISLADFDQALTIAVNQGGSKLANQPGQRPSVPEFAAIVNASRRKVEPEREPWPERTPEATRRHIEKCREILRAKGAIAP